MQPRAEVEKALQNLVPDLRGLWSGQYGPHGMELVDIEWVEGRTFRGTKVTGDSNVPGGKVTFRIQFDTNQTTEARGTLQIANVGFTQPQWTDANVLVVDNDHFSLQWQVRTNKFVRVRSTVAPRSADDPDREWLLFANDPIPPP